MDEIIKAIREVQKKKQSILELEERAKRQLKESLKPQRIEVGMLASALREKMESYCKPGMQIKITKRVHEFIENTDQYGHWGLRDGHIMFLSRIVFEYDCTDVTLYLTIPDGTRYYCRISIEELLETIVLGDEEQS